jgi:hypothetical protein
VILLHKEAHDQSARDDGSDLSGFVSRERILPYRYRCNCTAEPLYP